MLLDLIARLRAHEVVTNRAQALTITFMRTYEDAELRDARCIASRCVHHQTDA